MIAIVNKNPSGMFEAEEQWIQFTEVNDSLIIRPATPVQGISLANGFSIEYEGDLRFDFRYSPDEGLTWSPQMSLTDDNLQRFAYKKNHWVYFELIIVNQSDSESYFKSIDFNFDYQKPSISNTRSKKHNKSNKQVNQDNSSIRLHKS